MTVILWEDYRAALLRQAFRLARNAADAHDLVQDTFVRAYERVEQIRDVDTVLPWLRAILFSVFCNRHVKSVRRGGEPASLDVPDTIAEPRSLAAWCDPERIVFNAERMRILRSVIAALPAKHREPLLLCDIGELPYCAIAERLGVSPALVKSRIHRARLKIRESLTVKGYEL